jgi:DNA polymerase-3 subunit delta
MSSRKRSEAAARGDGAPSVVLLLGSEETLRDAALVELRTAALAGGPRDFNEDRFDFAAGGVDAARIVDAARTLPVLARQRLVRVRGLDDRRAQSFTEKLLLDYLERPSATTCLVLEAEKADRRLRWTRRVAEVGEVRECSGPRRPAEARDWVDARLRAQGRRAARGAAAALVEQIGLDLDRLSHEIEKACLYAGERNEITAEDFAAVGSGVRPLALYELTDALGRRDVVAALRLLAGLLDQGEPPLVILGALANHFRKLVRARDCDPLESAEIARRLSLHPFAAEKLAEQARRFDEPRLRSCLAAAREADFALKGGAALAPRLALERLLLAASARA